MGEGGDDRLVLTLKSMKEKNEISFSHFLFLIFSDLVFFRHAVDFFFGLFSPFVLLW